MQTVDQPADVRPVDAIQPGPAQLSHSRGYAFAEAARTEANRELTQIGKDLRALADRMAAWAEQHTDCQCVFCHATHNEDDHLSDDICGATWGMRTAAGFIEGDVFPLPD